MQTKKNYPLFKVLKKLIKYQYQECKMIYLLFVIFTIVATVYPFLAIVLPKLLTAQFVNINSNTMKNILIIVGSYLVLSCSIGYLNIYIKYYAYPKITGIRINVMKNMLDKLISVDYKYMEDAEFFEENDRALSACSSNVNGMEAVYHKLFETPSIIVGMLILVFLIGKLSILILAGLLLNMVTLIFIRKKVQEFSYSKKQEMGHARRRMDYYNKTTHDFEYGKDIRVYNFKQRIIDNYDREIDGFVQINKLIENRNFYWGFLSLFTLFLSEVCVYGVLIYKSLHGLPIEDFLMYMTAIPTLSSMLNIMASDFAEVYREGQYVDDFFNFMDENLGEEGGTTKAVHNDTLEIELKDVSFKYPKTEAYIFEHLNLKINKGEKLAIVGVNGAGKTTLVKLMTGLFDVTDGQIFINGINIKQYNKKELFKMFSVVFQEVNIFPFSVKENVASTSANIDEERVLSSLEKVGLKEKVLGYKKGLDQMLSKIIDSDGTDLSGGEKQKMSIARAIYKDANMVIMDEPTAALDALAEAEIYKNFDDLVKNKTAIYISHRLASTKFCDKIAMFDNKELIEYGSHDELMDRKGKYYEMFNIQGKYYKKDGVTNE